jgi:hypothetical protein
MRRLPSLMRVTFQFIRKPMERPLGLRKVSNWARWTGWIASTVLFSTSMHSSSITLSNCTAAKGANIFFLCGLCGLCGSKCKAQSGESVEFLSFQQRVSRSIQSIRPAATLVIRYSFAGLGEVPQPIVVQFIAWGSGSRLQDFKPRGWVHLELKIPEDVSPLWADWNFNCQFS